MSLTIEIKINGQTIGGAIVHNVSNLADLSDYDVEIVEKPEPSLGIPFLHRKVRIEGHPRRQTVWALVSKITAAALGGRDAG